MSNESKLCAGWLDNFLPVLSGVVTGTTRYPIGAGEKGAIHARSR